MSYLTSPDDGATPLSQDEMLGLKLDYIATREELNEAEQANILEARQWAVGRRHSDLLTEAFTRELHKRMFGKVWNWAGTFTQERSRTIGVDSHEVGPQLYQLLGSVEYWLANKTFPPDEIAARFHQRLTQIHPFPNGNGRHARLMTDLLLEEMAQPPFTWGQRQLRAQGTDRKKYIEALRKADQGDFQDLLNVVRS